MGMPARVAKNNIKVCTFGHSIVDSLFAVGAARTAFTNAVLGRTGLADVTFVDCSYGGRYVTEECATASGDPGLGFWNVTGNTAGTMMTTALATLATQGAYIDAILMNIGYAETTALAGSFAPGYSVATAQAHMLAGLQGMANSCRTAINSANPTSVPIIFQIMGRRSGSLDLGMERARQVQLQFIATGTNIHHGGELYNAVLQDTSHPSDAWYENYMAGYLAEHVANVCYGKTGREGPSIVSWTKVNSTTVDVLISPDDNDTITTPASPQHFRVEDSAALGTAVTISGYAWSGNTLRLTLASPLSGSPVGFYPYDWLPAWTTQYDPDQSSVIKGSVSGLPLRSWYRAS